MYHLSLYKRVVSPFLHVRNQVLSTRLFTSIGLSRDTDTIYALCSGPLVKAGVSVIRVSGSNAFDCIKEMTKESSLFPEFRKATVRSILDSKSKDEIDKGMVICFQEGKSYTSENCVEFHVHGSPAVVSAVLQSLSRIPSFRPADAGEFTKRAFMNGKMSFLEVEALGDLLNAETENQRKQAMRGVNGEFTEKCWKWRDQLMKCLASAETIIDFSDDVDDESALLTDSTGLLQSIQIEMQHIISSYNYSKLIKDGIKIALAGPPNAGKSSLLNMLVGSECAIVSSTPGTTRDVLKVDMDLDGYKVILQDTAGLRETQDAIELEGIKRAKRAVESSVICLVLLDITTDIISSLQSVMNSIQNKDVIVVLNKKDLLPNDHIQQEYQTQIQNCFPSVKEVLSISCLCPDEANKLIKTLTNIIHNRMEEEVFDENAGLITRERQRNCIEQCINSLQTCINLQEEDLVDLQAEELRCCLKSLARLTGDVDVEEILDIVFSDFCIGK